MKYINEQNIASVINEVQNGMSARKAAALFGLHHATLSRRLRGAQPVKTTKICKQRLSPAQEDFLADWCLNEEKAGRAPSKKQVAAFAKEMLLDGGDDEPLSHHWIERYLKRNPRVRTKNSTLLESARVRGSTRKAYEDFYGRLRYQINSKGIIPRNIANMDEHGMQELETRAGKVIGDALTKQALVESSDDTT